ncbi:MAG: hypothetical protein CVU91_03145 [Firmicutes bacterium HGW-Firmicutes-16]|nr:MAG: hypothetical protein CVU91_03145 [Firmicutes bacterium HGW-Firmicutes-16]
MIFKHLKTIAIASVLVGTLAVSANASSIGGVIYPPKAPKLFPAPESSPIMLATLSESSHDVDSAKISGGLLDLNFKDQPIIFSNLIELKSDNSELNSDEIEGQKIVDTAMLYLGTPYVWGGTSEKGFDCSGFVQYVYKECGYTINRTAADIYENGTYVEKENLEIGDAICFSSHTESIGHVGIYIGNEQFIHASSGSGCVIISDLSEDYYTNRYIGSRHIV